MNADAIEPRSARTFNEERKTLGPVPNVFWGHLSEYENLVGKHSGIVASPVQSAPIGEDDALESPGVQQAPELDRLYRAAQGEPHELAEVLAEATGIDLRRFLDSVRKDEVASGAADLEASKSGTDAFGWYRPWHAYHASRRSPWGMYLSVHLLLQWVQAVWTRHRKRITEKRLPFVPHLLISAVYRHELFHYHVERFATRLEVIQREPVYRPYVERVRATVAGTDRWLEEALAQGAVLRSRFVVRRSGFTPRLMATILREEFRRFPPGYRDFDCEWCGGTDRAHRLFGAQVARARADIAEPEWVTDLALPLKEYASDARGCPGYLVWSADFAQRFQLPTPDKRRFDRYARLNGIEYEKPGPGDHGVYRVSGQRVQVNFVGKDLDFASLKALARAIGKSPSLLAREMSRC